MCSLNKGRTFLSMLTFVLILLNIICVLVGVAFFTLFERKLLGYIQLRKGPNKTGLAGLFQPFADAIKLFSKEHVNPSLSNYVPFVVSPIIRMFLALAVWSSLPIFNITTFSLSILFFLCCVRMGVYALMASGWSSNSKYSLFGALRAVAQTISYEVSLALTLLIPVLLVGDYDIASFAVHQRGCWFIFIMPLVAMVWFVSCLAETNRTPFDFAERESELVSGFNTEYRRGGFAMIMLAEYTSILFMSMLFVVIFIGGMTTFIGPFSFMSVAFLFVWVRGTLPRFRYDKLMYLAWKSFLPFSLVYLIFISGVLTLAS